MTLRSNVWQITSFKADVFQGVASPPVILYEVIMFLTVVLNVVLVIGGTEEALRSKPGYTSTLYFSGVLAIILFTIDHCLRLWSCVEDQLYGALGPFKGRLYWFTRPMSVIDLLAITPFYVDVFMPYQDESLPLLSIRIMLTFRIILPVLRIERQSRAFETLMLVARNARWELFVTGFVAMLLIITSSTIMYYLECGRSSCTSMDFNSIPTTMWWSVSALTTVGYGDVVPHTWQGRLFACFVSFMGIAMFALPAGILGSGFVQIVLEKKNRRKHQFDRSPAIGATPSPTDVMRLEEEGDIHRLMAASARDSPYPTTPTTPNLGCNCRVALSDDFTRIHKTLREQRLMIEQLKNTQLLILEKLSSLQKMDSTQDISQIGL
eukprot:c7456_g1_i2.p1 GENE.c7456_g1_i2~~c7456_g1_i2.p1  ORF type:complete len:379 (+),score=77.20 c7456_g1_i2:28-1164(+)